MRLIKQLPLAMFSAVIALAVQAEADVRVQRAAIAANSTSIQQVQHNPSSSSGVKSYREWKAERVNYAQYRVAQVMTQLETRKMSRLTASGTDPNLAQGAALEAVPSHDISIEKLERQLREEKYSLEVAKELSVTDYFVGYLTKVQNKKSAFQEVAGKLSAEEVAELMNAYANSVFGAHASDLPPSAINLSKDSYK